MEKAKILIVEDQGIVALDLQTRVKGLGHTVLDVVPSGEEAIQKVGNRQPDLVIMDIHLRGSLTGIDAAREIWSRFNIPVVYLTAVGDQKILEGALEVSRTFGYAGKPFHDAELQSAIESTLRRHQAEKTRDQDAAQSTKR